MLLSFGPELKGKLHLQLLIPPGAGPFPVFMTTSVERCWVEIALRRGYIGCIVAASDGNDDTEFFAPLYPDYDFTCLARRAWGISRAIDYLITLPVVDKAKIIFTDHSRGGKMATWAGAFEERLAAVVGSTPVSGGASPGAIVRTATSTKPWKCAPETTPTGTTQGCASSSAGRTSCLSICMRWWP